MSAFAPTVHSFSGYLWLAAHPHTANYSDRELARIHSGEEQVLLLTMPDNLVCKPPPNAVPYQRLASLLSKPDALTDLQAAQISGSRCPRSETEDKRIRLVTQPLMDLITHHSLTKLTLWHVDVAPDSFVSIVNNGRLKYITLSEVRFLAVENLTEELCYYEFMEELAITNTSARDVLFLGSGITSLHRIHLHFGVERTDPRGDSESKLWAALKKSTGGTLTGIRAITFAQRTAFQTFPTLWSDLLTCESVSEINLYEARFDTTSFNAFTSYISSSCSPLRFIGLTFWNVVPGYYEGDELDRFLLAVQKGNVVWYSHERISGTIAARIANALPVLPLEALHLEIVEHWLGKTLIPSQELMQAARANTTLGVFNNPGRAALAEKHSIRGLDVRGSKYYDYDVCDDETIFEVFTEQEKKELMRLFVRNRETAYL